ncbi:hypothetical protein ACIRFH_16035 [Streptomyces sp. NPDC093586]|uniref:hypothetical protein n=1 Tax=Streptomyces sp. NPDC093586 TaxID=3366042 RepID=UPI003808217F
MVDENDNWQMRLKGAVEQYEEGRLGLDRLAETLLALVSDATSGRGATYEVACELAAELERHHDLRTSPWNTPDDVGPDDERDLAETVAEVRKLTTA